jgi:hypothetical protein
MYGKALRWDAYTYVKLDICIGEEKKLKMGSKSKEFYNIFLMDLKNCTLS